MLAIQGRGYADMFPEDPIKLGKTVESAGCGNFRDGNVGVDQQSLHIPDPRHLDLVCDRESGDVLELVRQIACADAESFRQILQRDLLGIMGMNVTGYGVDLLLHGGHL